MDKTELEYKQALCSAMELGDQAELVKTLTAKWLEDSQEWIIEALKTCQDNEVMGLRNKLVALEDFKDWLNAKITNAKIAKGEFETLSENKEPANTYSL